MGSADAECKEKRCRIMFEIKDLKYKIFITFVLLLAISIMRVLSVPCIFLKITGIECLGCGMTRAWIEVLHLNFIGAFSTHMMFWSVPVLYLCFLLDGKLFSNSKANIVFYAFIIAGFIINWAL